MLIDVYDWLASERYGKVKNSFLNNKVYEQKYGFCRVNKQVQN